MFRKQYRVEVNYPKEGSPQYFLAKNVNVKGKRSKVKKYIGTIPPTPAHIDYYSRKHAFEIETRAAEKKAEMSSALYSADYLTLEQVKKIEELKFLYKTFTEFLTVNEIEAYEKKFEMHYVHGTTSIEGNTLSLEETHDLLIDGIVPKDKPLREINEVQNFKKVKKYRDEYKGKVTVKFIKTLHSKIMDNIDCESAGVFRRTDDIGIIGCDLIVAPSVIIEEELLQIIDDYYTNIENGKYPFEQAVLFHYNFEILHPFTDGNGRVGREVFNYMLVKEDYPRLLFLGRDRERYISALKLGNLENYGEMVEHFADLIISQRAEVVRETLKELVTRKPGQRTIADFVL